MRIVIDSTEELGTIDGVRCRKWIGTTEGGVPCFVFVPRIAVERQHEPDFERERAGSPLVSTGVGDAADGLPRPHPLPRSFDPRFFS